MQEIELIVRELTSEEYQQTLEGFDQHTRDHQILVQDSQRFTVVAVKGVFIGCATGLAYRNEGVFSSWFYLTDLFVEKGYRKQGIGSRLLNKLESQIVQQGVNKIWTWTAGYEAPGFYLRQGYRQFADLEDWYSDGSSRIGFRKTLV